MKKSVSELQESLNSALSYDEHRKRVNDSKFRAVAQRMDYEGFRQLVLGADLKCTKAGEMERLAESKDSVFNANYRTTQSQASVGIRNSFYTSWRRTHDPREKLELLKGLDQDNRDTLLTTSLEADFFADLVSVISSVEDPSVPELVAKILESPHYSRSLKMLSRKEKAAWEAIIPRPEASDQPQ
mmetsp:Transcript_9532/g.18491  ORF Transcript_9532/g.18491 Transcript_9532/m.18491 type:complete len:185 (-) Transcript_9532:5617-6171(-)